MPFGTAPSQRSAVEDNRALRIRVVYIDSVQGGPPHDRSPVIRIFGSDDKGVRSCVHVHGIFPYFFVLCDHAPAWGFEGFQSPETYLRVFREALDAEVKADRAVERVRRAAGVSGARANGHGDAADVDDDGDDDDAGAVDPAAREEAAVARAVRDRSRSILAVEWVSAHPMYGFHRRRCCFIRVVCRDQGARLAAARLLRAGRVLGHAFQPYELHVGPVLQAMMDRGRHWRPSHGRLRR
ncbi:hypothetical protein FNF29_00828 [Cafeteria roenbergensis]|uniref:DNA-directed DNA polymerase family B exonuclease domain-containing protein n=1 Tax=Cafeteria roenbergensis TaxID=33653 RepID=A0A5A8D155_CAFRO|nr:hypothetical protein FNF29_00828 [Cafeteria roenbergensis]KAA0158955.1 hypothetical protein FNF31_05125 [Cafeteria roenbergensis]KAA0165155.1 hypothetical protein FNF28_03554 [Cafeteria roenbergensis]|eukprot:KAA0156717.1 hypothetical protein FNF29_00828 [Cafeteria roenbergensis]